MPSSSPRSLHADTRLRVIAIIGAVITGGWITVALYAAHPALPYNTIRLPYAHQIGASLWAPQGWAFFTRDPREERLSAYVRQQHGWTSPFRGPNARPANWFGFDRTPRAQGPEMSALAAATDRAAWSDCDGPLEPCLDQLRPHRRIRTLARRPTFCGAIALATRPPVPWAWASVRPTVEMPAKVAMVEVQC